RARGHGCSTRRRLQAAPRAVTSARWGAPDGLREPRSARDACALRRARRRPFRAFRAGGGRARARRRPALRKQGGPRRDEPDACGERADDTPVLRQGRGRTRALRAVARPIPPEAPVITTTSLIGSRSSEPRRSQTSLPVEDLHRVSVTQLVVP